MKLFLYLDLSVHNVNTTDTNILALVSPRTYFYYTLFYKKKNIITILLEPRASISGRKCRLSLKLMNEFQKCVLLIVAGSLVICVNINKKPTP